MSPNMKLSRAILVIWNLALPSAGLVSRKDTTHSRIEAKAAWKSLGCYTDNASGRALPYSVVTPGGDAAMTNEACQNACQSADYSIAGTEYAGECCKS